jgi:hypothetical protein
MTRKYLIHATGLGLILIAAGTVEGQAARACAPHDAVVQQLAEGYGESPRALGLGSNNVLMHLFANEVSGSWTITVTTPAGISCLLASGEAFRPVPAPPPGTDG